MADRLICPVCGESNPADMEFCRNCQSRLQPLGGSLKSEGDAIQPGELPTKKVTSELEPLLPQWLRDARQQARDNAAADQSKADQEQSEAPGSSTPDLLDGLASQSQDEDEDIPDWLAQITGATSKKKKAPAEDNQVKWVELGREPQMPPLDEEPKIPPQAPTPPARAAEKDELTDWFKQAAASSETADFRMPQPPPVEPPAAPQTPRPAEDLSWLTNLGAADALPPEPPAESTPPAREEAPDWLKKLQAEQAPPPAPPAPAPSAASQADVPDWLKSFEQGAPATQPVEPSATEQPAADFGVPDWLRELPAAPAEAPSAAPEPPSTETPAPAELPDWMSSLRSEQETPLQAEAQPAPDEPSAPVELPDWIASLGSEHEAVEPAQQPPAGQEAIPPAELPDWISALGAPQTTPPAAEPEPAASESIAPVELPDWISALGTEQAAQRPSDVQPSAEQAFVPTELPDWMSALGTEQAAPQEPGQQPAPEQATSAAELPDWLSSLGVTSPAAAEIPTPAPEPALPPSEPPVVKEPPPAGAAFAPEALAGEDVDAVFASMQTPDWLSAVLPSAEEAEESEPAPAQATEEPIGPAELPSWVQAMRPVESVMAPAAGADEDIATEKRGPLAGLRGVLPAAPGAGQPSSKPKPQSFKLNASEQQLAHAALLERILGAETSPIPMRTGAVLSSQKILRWSISLLLLVVLGGIVFGGTKFFALPSGVPNETVAAISAVEAIPADAPVLVVFDYQPSTVGEMEASGGPLLDHLLLLNHPRLALLSTSPTGSALAERFMSRVLSSRGYIRDQQYVDLGYLPGGLAGVYNFAQNPSATVPLDASLRAAWQSSFLTSVRNFSDFAAVIVLTDSIESGRAWVEQTALARGQSKMVLVASAQAGPMLLPYVDSGQVNGIVSGLYGAVGVEQQNAGSPGLVRRYWDAYSVGLYLAVALIALGGLWNLWLGIRERRTQVVG